MDDWRKIILGTFTPCTERPVSSSERQPESDGNSASAAVQSKPSPSSQSSDDHEADGKEGKASDDLKSTTKKPVFKSTLYSNEPSADEVISIFANVGKLETITTGIAEVGLGGSKDRHEAKNPESAELKSDNLPIKEEQGNAVPNDQTNTAGDTANEAVGGTGSGVDAEEEETVGGACGGSAGGKTVQEFLLMEGVTQMYAIQPLPWCPHLVEVKPLPARPLNVKDPCETCGDESENWVCLTCFRVECSRFVQEHMLYHKLETDHNMCLSYSDLSVWCYSCDQYVDNQILQPMKSAAHFSKFGESLPTLGQ